MVSVKLLFICQFLHVKISEKTNILQRLLDVIFLRAEILSASPVLLRSGGGSSPPSSFFTPEQHADTLPTELPSSFLHNIILECLSWLAVANLFSPVLGIPSSRSQDLLGV